MIVDEGIEYDEILIETFGFVFSFFYNSIINIALITRKCNTIRFDNSVKYVFSSITSLFSKDFIRNFLFLRTFSDNFVKWEGLSFARLIEFDN